MESPWSGVMFRILSRLPRATDDVAQSASGAGAQAAGGSNACVACASSKAATQPSAAPAIGPPYVTGTPAAVVLTGRGGVKVSVASVDSAKWTWNPGFPTPIAFGAPNVTAHVPAASCAMRGRPPLKGRGTGGVHVAPPSADRAMDISVNEADLSHTTATSSPSAAMSGPPAPKSPPPTPRSVAALQVTPSSTDR